MDLVFDYLLANVQNIDRIHFYGIGMQMIREYIVKLESKGLQITIDSTKWTRAVTKKLKLAHGVCCRKNTRDLYFTTSMNEIRKIGINVKY